MVNVTVFAAGRSPIKEPLKLSFEGKELNEVTIGDIKAAIATKHRKLYPARQKLSLKGEKKVLDDDRTLQDAGVVDGDELSVKDLGPQIGWQTVFFIEYVGPLIIHPFIYHTPKFWYGIVVPKSQLQSMVYVMILLHFFKRELETAFVHRFSKGTMPFFNIFKNSGHYWLLSGFAMAIAIYSPEYETYSYYMRGTARLNPKFLWGCIALWAFAELSNLYVHLKLRALRPAGTRTRAIPHGYGFELVSFPNYFFEILSWVAIAIMTGSHAAWFFVAVSSYTMIVWAVKKHKAYKREFGDAYPKHRKAIIPFII